MSELVGIFGTGRNGSTLLARLLDGIPGAYAHPVECNFLNAIDDLAWRPTVRRATIQNAVNRPLRHLNRGASSSTLRRFYRSHWQELEDDYLPQFDPPLVLGEHPATALGKSGRQRAEEFVPAFLSACAKWVEPSADVDMFIMKTIETPYVADYERIFPAMRFIHIVRSPVDVWASQKRSIVTNKGLPPWYLGGENLITTLECRWIPHAEAVAMRLNNPRHFIARYEDLIAAPSEMVTRICEWLGSPAPAEPDVQTLFGGRHPREMQLNPSQRGVETPRRAVSDLHQKHKFDSVVTQREHDLIAIRCRDLAAKLGYDLPTVSPENTRTAWRAMDEWDFRNTKGVISWLRSVWALGRRRSYVSRRAR